MNGKMIPYRMNVTLLQRDIVAAAPAENRRRMEGLLEGLPETDLVVLPEMFSTGFCTLDRRDTIVCDDGETLPWMQRMAEKYRFALAGSLACRVTEAVRRNRFFFVMPDGAVRFYDKKHLFSYAGEERYFTAGDRRVVVEYKGFRFLLQVCYDIRFPVWSRYRGDYDAIIYVANFPALRIEAWRTLVRARAIENQCYVIAVNRVGSDQATSYNGYSAVIDAYGEPLTACADEACIASADLDKRRLDVFRRQFPVWRDAD